ncbi:3-methyl-2-oxobutanoate hydroxymethyltransferase [Rhodoferax sp. 4810]|uniref:3-methyl-2-oxobutanoate hydroxymethyltransferase n=1 Tax=Thiospirillum jenense TaxID=1653858 RepID=A0A839HCH8_9GAMM|nr:3-methyl-2-oxobutanoate hydroxymethyltransferase [Thiospirillum jenense]MBB1073974.1 3-methyl-2-oxobutanoate hydroxymethyltransferase [Rhodoferax jenense]MBB1125850.1 3-methyl-2-oxobutanoate hydroxymethyltransferase [Thiospirillum jenense]
MTNERITAAALLAMKQRQQRIAVLTCYDASFAQLLEAAGVEVLLVGDSLGMVLQGHDTTLPVTLDHMVYHSACVSRAAQRALVIADLPFLSFATPERALDAAARLLGEGGARMVKLEGGGRVIATVEHLTNFGVPVCAHLGLLPQSVHRLGGFRYQGKDSATAIRIEQDALALQAAGAQLLVLECVPAVLAATLSERLTIPVIGIGAGNRCDGQVLVLYDIVGATAQRPPRFSKNFLTGTGTLPAAIAAYVAAVKSGEFPGREQTLA